MITKRHYAFATSVSTILVAIWSACPASAQTSPAPASPLSTIPTPAEQAPPAAEQGVADIIVTAQKRSENVNRVGISITAATADTLRNLGISDARDLGKLVPGFTYTESSLNSPVYTIRGVGYYETSLAATPAVDGLCRPDPPDLPPDDAQRGLRP